MGEYERTYKMIAELKERKKAIKEAIETLYDELHDVEVSIGECEGYLAELRYIDGEDYQYEIYYSYIGDTVW